MVVCQCQSINITIVIIGKGRYLNIIYCKVYVQRHIFKYVYDDKILLSYEIVLPKQIIRLLCIIIALDVSHWYKGIDIKLLSLYVLIFTKRAIYNPKVHNRASIQWVKAVSICSGIWTWLIGPTQLPK